MRPGIIAAILVSVVASPAIAACDPGETALRIGHTGPAEGTARAETVRMLADRVEERLGGRLCLDIVEPAALEAQETVVSALGGGAVDLAVADASTLGAVSPAFLLFDLPFLFDGIEHVMAFDASPEGRGLLAAGEGAGVVGLAFWLDGFEQISADRPIRRPEDAAGLTFAAGLSEIERGYFTVLQAGWIDFSRAEVFHALRDGVIEGQNSSWATMSDWDLHRVQDHAAATNHSVAVDVLLAAGPAWERLEPALRAELEQVVAEVSHEANRLVYERGEAAKARLIAAGMAVHELSGAERAEWRGAMRPVWSEFEGAIGPALITAASAR